jgi:hypothetical protein
VRQFFYPASTVSSKRPRAGAYKKKIYPARFFREGNHGRTNNQCAKMINMPREK